MEHNPVATISPKQRKVYPRTDEQRKMVRQCRIPSSKWVVRFRWDNCKHTFSTEDVRFCWTVGLSSFSHNQTWTSCTNWEWRAFQGSRLKNKVWVGRRFSVKRKKGTHPPTPWYLKLAVVRDRSLSTPHDYSIINELHRQVPSRQLQTHFLNWGREILLPQRTSHNARSTSAKIACSFFLRWHCTDKMTPEKDVPQASKESH